LLLPAEDNTLAILIERYHGDAGMEHFDGGS
jgi:hypothetical protein